MQELAYEKKQQYLADYRSFSSWISDRRGSDDVVRKALSEQMTFFKVEGIIANRKEDSMTQLLSSVYALNIPLTMVFQIDNHKLTVCIGSSDDNIEVLQGLFTKVIGCRCLEQRLTEQEVFSKKAYRFESAVAGDAVYKEEHCQSVLDILLSGGLFDECSVVVSAAPLSREMGVRISDYFDRVATEIGAITSRQITSRDDKDSVTYTEENGYLKRFEEIVGALKKKYEDGRREGLFISSVKIYAESPIINDLVAGTYLSQSANEDYPEILQHIRLKKSCYNSEIYMSMRNISINGRSIKLPEAGNFFTSSELAYFMDFPKKDTLGFYQRIIPDFDVERSVDEGILIGDVLKMGTAVSEYHLPLSELNRNALVSGLVGSGKTNTVEHLVKTMNRESVPFMVIEPVKTEYFELKNEIENLKVVSVGSVENGLVLNPFQPVSEDVSLQKHVDSLYSAIMAAFEWVPPMPQIVEKVIYRVYCDNGFDVANNIRNPKGNYPTIEQAYWTIRTVVKEEKFDARMESDLIGCIGARFNSLRVGNKGRTLNVKKSMPMNQLFEANCVIELEEIQDEEVRSFIIGLLLANLREYCMLRETSHLGVQHCTVIEEAHTLLKKIDSSSSAAQAKGVKVFSEMIKTLRAKGESFIIVDQVPTELADDVIKNTNLKIAHRTVAADDKSVLGKTMNCTDDQEAYMTVLKRGEALVFSEGDYRPKIVKIPFAGINKEMTREKIMKLSEFQKDGGESLYDMNPVCLYCENQLCSSFEEVLNNAEEGMLGKWMDRVEEIKDKDEFENFCIEIVIKLKRMGLEEYECCVVSKLTDAMNLTIQEKHEIYAIYRALQR
ncbi:MAG: hypothetical protein PUB52_02110 [Lachnospiraceae bacterium]|nr:hypothetical protein [Lachnospiraceae bacterium]